MNYFFRIKIWFTKWEQSFTRCKQTKKDIRFASSGVLRIRRGTWDHLVPKPRNSSENFGTVSQRGFAFFRRFAFRFLGTTVWYCLHFFKTCFASLQLFLEETPSEFDEIKDNPIISYYFLLFMKMWKSKQMRAKRSRPVISKATLTSFRILAQT